MRRSTCHRCISITPWFFLCGQNNIFAKNNQAFAFDPDSNEWIKLPSTLFPVSISQESSFIGSGGFFFNISANNFSYGPILIPLWRETTPLKFSRLNPLVGVISSEFSSNSNPNNGCGGNLNLPRIIVVGGVRFIRYTFMFHIILRSEQSGLGNLK